MKALFALACLFCSFSPAFAGTIQVDLSDRTLTYQGKTYPVAVPRPGASKPIGTFTILRKAVNPTWSPTKNMLSKKPWLRTIRGGSEKNPLGTRALYLYRNGAPTLYRIHGTNAPKSIGTAASSGCVRMHKDDVEALFDRVPIGTKVVIRK